MEGFAGFNRHYGRARRIFPTIGLLAVNLMAVISYRQVLLAEGYEAALGQHVPWGSLLLFLIIYGPGKLSLDYLLNRSRL